MRMSRVLLTVLFLLAPAWALPGDNLKKGEPLPSIVEADQNGTVRDLSNLSGPRGAILVVFRSADW